MATHDPVAQAAAALDVAIDRLRGVSDPTVQSVVGRLYVRLEAVRAVAPRDPQAAALLADDLADVIAVELGAGDLAPGRHAARGARLLGAAA